MCYARESIITFEIVEYTLWTYGVNSIFLCDPSLRD